MAYCEYKDGNWYTFPEHTPPGNKSYKVYREGEKPEQAQLVSWCDGRWQMLYRNDAGDLQLKDWANVAYWQYYTVKIRVY